MKPNARLFRVSVVIFLAAVCTAASAQISKQGSGYLLRMKFTKGDVARYTMTSASGGSGVPAMNLKMPMSMKVLSVAKGVGQIEYSVGPMTNNGKAVVQAQKGTSKVDSRGKVTGSSAQLQQMGNITFPEKAIRVGETWKGTQTTQTGPGGSLTLNASYTFAGIKTVKGKPVAEIKVSVSGANQMMKTAGTGVMQLLVADGSLFSTTMDQTMTFAQGQQSMSVKNKTQIVRQ